MLPVVSIVGTSGSGKTTLLVKVVAELKRRGIRVATIKHDAHGFEIDKPGKDSWRHKKAGAATVALSSPKKLAIIKSVAREWTPERIIASSNIDPTDTDVVITEGYKTGKFKKIEVIRAAHSSKSICKRDKNLIAYATDTKIKSSLPKFAIDDYKAIASFIMHEIVKKQMTSSLAIVADGKMIELNPFIEDLVTNGVLGMIRCLKGCERARTIELKVRKQ